MSSKSARITVKATPGAKNFSITGFNEWTGELEVKLKNPPLKGKANQELIHELEKVLNAEVRLLSGEKSRRKQVEVLGKSQDEVRVLIKSFKV
ncbi:MAG: YggU family protein [Candidatus Diapherotrites archaeon]|nr:YggU family protein [Candidatus Diapherotrites archaeon]